MGEKPLGKALDRVFAGEAGTPCSGNGLDAVMGAGKLPIGGGDSVCASTKTQHLQRAVVKIVSGFKGPERRREHMDHCAAGPGGAARARRARTIQQSGYLGPQRCWV